MKTAGFEDKLLARLAKLDPDQVEGYLRRLLAEKQFLLSVFNHLDEGIIVTDGSLIIQFINRRARSVLGWPRDKDHLGEALDRHVAPDHPLREIIGSLRQDLREIEGHECSFGPNGDRILRLTVLPMRAERTGEEYGEEAEDLLIVLLRDVTEHQRRQSEQERASRLASMATLTSGIAHEIKNPLTSLNIHTQLLEAEVSQARREGRPLDRQTTERASQVIHEETDRMARIIEEFLQAARPTSPNLEARDLRPVIESARRIHAPQCEQLGVEFSVRIDPELPSAMVDNHLILQALRNLLNNGLDALKERIEQSRELGEVFHPVLKLEAELSGDSIRLSVSDNGPGIAEDVREKILEPYFTTKFGGTGLGLMVVYRIVAEHRGVLDVETDPGQWTCFSIALPLHQRPVRLLRHDDMGSPANSDSQQTGENGEGSIESGAR